MPIIGGRPPERRTDEEREAARIERERRRAESSPTAALTDPPADEASPEAGEEVQPVAGEELPVAGDAPPVAGDAPDVAGDAPEVAGDAPPVAGEETPEEPRSGELRTEAFPPEETLAEEPLPGERERPQRPRRSPPSRSSRSRHNRSQKRRPRRAPARVSARARLGALCSLLLVGVIVWLLVSIFQPFHGAGNGRVIVAIPQGASAGTVGDILAREDVISSSFFFDIRTFLDGSRGELHSGRFIMAHGMSYSEAIEALTTNVPQTEVVKVVIPEGETRRQIAAIARKAHLKGSYLEASRQVPGFSPSHYGAHGHPSLEGFLFPATYDVEAHANVSRLVDEQLEAFNERFGSSEIAAAHKLGITPYGLLTVASMVEREAKLPHDRPLVAAVIYNRLRLGMPLGVDATIRYALNDYNRPLTESQLKDPSPYNTRLHTGLPPTPISNPGMESIEAATHPAHVGYLYYVNGADGCGDLAFSSDISKFEEDTAAYNAALEANGGNVPSCKQKG